MSALRLIELEHSVEVFSLVGEDRVVLCSLEICQLLHHLSCIFLFLLHKLLRVNLKKNELDHRHKTNWSSSLMKSIKEIKQ